MPAHRTRGSLSLPGKPLEVKTDAPFLSVAIVSPTPRAHTFPSDILDGPTPRAFTFPPNIQDSNGSPLLSPLSPSTPSSVSSSSSPSYSSSSSYCQSPCESDLDLNSLDIRRTASPSSLKPLPAINPPLSKFASAPSSPASSATASGHRRRTSAPSTTSILSTHDARDHRPKKGDTDYIKRPENAFILFRRECCLQKNAALSLAASQSNLNSGSNETITQRRQRQADLSKSISQQWRALKPEEKAYWDALAKQRKKEHEEMYPWYVYQPTRSKEKGEGKGAGTGEKASQGVKGRNANQRPRKGKGKALTPESDEFADYSSTNNESVVSSASASSASCISVSSFVFPSTSSRRASSMPTPPPSIKLPQLLPAPVLSPSCPNSPLTQPAMSYANSRRRGQFLHAVPTDGGATHFRFLSNEALGLGNANQEGQSEHSSPSNMYPSLYDTPPMPMLDQTNTNTNTESATSSSSRRSSLVSLSIPHDGANSPTPSAASISPGPSTPQRTIGNVYGYIPPNHPTLSMSPDSPSSASGGVPQTPESIGAPMMMGHNAGMNVPSKGMGLGYNMFGMTDGDMGMSMDNGMGMPMEFGGPLDVPMDIPMDFASYASMGMGMSLGMNGMGDFGMMGMGMDMSWMNNGSGNVSPSSQTTSFVPSSTSSSSSSPSSASASGMTAPVTVAVADNTSVGSNANGSENENTYGLPTWALSTLWPNLSSSSSSSTYMDMANIPPLELDIPSSHSHSRSHSNKGDDEHDDAMDILDAASLTDPLFGLQFRFEDLLDTSHL